MKFNIEKIAEINTQKDLEKFNPNKPLFYQNYLFHYLIIFDKLELLKLMKHPVYNFNEDKLDAFMLAAKYDNFKILEYLLTSYPEYSQNHNEEGLNFINFISKPSKLISLMKKFKNINWEYLLKFKNQKNIENYIYILSELNEADLEWILNNYKIFNAYYSISAIIINKNINDSIKIKLFNKFNDKEINTKNYENEGIINDLIISQNVKLTEYFINRNIDLEYVMKTTTSFLSPFFSLILIIMTEGINEKLEKILELIFNKIQLDYNYVDHNGINYVQLVLKLLIYNSDIKSSILNNIIDKILLNSPDSAWKQINLNKENALFYIIQLDFKKYQKYIKNRELNIKQKNINNKSIHDLSSDSWKNGLKTIKQYKENNDIDVKITENKYQHQTKFTAIMFDIIIYFIYLSKKYKNLCIPKILESNNNRNDYPWVINYTFNTIDIHPNLNVSINNIRREHKYDYALIFLALTLENDLKHANILLYDFKNLTIERFDPYGDDGIDNEIDDLLEEELTWNTGLKYLKPSDYLPKPSYQLLSNENNLDRQKVGDFGGFCLGWCIWYVEHRLKNLKIDPKTLNKKTLEKLLQSNNNLTEFIRNYSNKLFDEKYKIMKNICDNNDCIDEKNISNIYISNDDQIKILKYANNFFGIHKIN